MSTPMSPNAPADPDDFREQLSAWHDGALSDEASRFVLRRLLRDDRLRAEVGRWQVIGDTLRRQAQERPTVDLASRVAATVAAEDAPARPATATARAGALRWLATAAAVGLAAILIWPSTPAPVGGSARDLVALAPAAPVVSVPVAPPGHPLPMPPRRVEAVPVDTRVAAVPPLVRAPQPTPEQLAPLPAVDAPSRPWPRGDAPQGAYTVDYGVPAATARQ